MRKLFALFLLTLPAFGAYSHIRPITIDHTKVKNSNLTNFPVTIVGNYPYLKFGQGVTNGQGFDIIFASDSGCTTKLNFEQAKFNAAGDGQAEYHVEIPTLSHTQDTTIYLCYGNASVTTYQGASPWDASYTDVNHFGDNVSINYADSTGTISGGLLNTGSAAAGRSPILGSAFLSNKAGGNNLHTADTAIGLATSGNKTFETWISPASFKSAAFPTGLLVYGKTGASIYSMQLRNDGTGTDRQAGFAFFDGTNFQIATGPTLFQGRWYHLVGVVNANSKVAIWVNGVEYPMTVTTAPATGDNTYSFVVGQDIFDSDPASFFDGLVDEIRVSNIARSGDWIQTEYANQSSPDTFYSIGQELTNSSNISHVAVSATNTQAVINFTYTSDPSTCKLWVADNINFSPVVHDTDWLTFTGSDAVNRDSSNIITGHTAKVLVGKRYAAAYGSDGNRYSRALEQNKPHYFEIACGNADAYEGSFRTAPIAMGDTHLEAIPSDSASAGNPTWPTPLAFARCNSEDEFCPPVLSYSAIHDRRDMSYIDPQTGIALRHLIMPDDMTIAEFNLRAGWAPATTGWTVPAGWVSSSNQNATITASTTPLSIGVFNDNAFSFGDVISDSNYKIPVMLQFNITASLGNVACASGSTSADCRMDVCVTTNWTTCAPNAQTYQQQVTTAATQYTFGSGEMYDVMQKNGKRIWNQSETGWRGGGVTCDGSTTVTKIWDSGTAPTDSVTVGSYIWLYPIGNHLVTSNIDSLHFTLDTACPDSSVSTGGAQGPAAGQWFIGGSAFGLLVWKETNSADTLTLANEFVNDLAGSDTNPQYNSGFYGAPMTVTLPNGDQAGVLQLRQSQYSIDLTTGKVGAFMPSTPYSGLSAAIQGSSFDNAGNFWTIGTDKSLIKYVYQGDFATATNKLNHPELPLWEYNLGSFLPTCGGSVTTNCFNAPSTITQAGQTLDVLLTAFDARYNTNPFGNWNFTAVEMGKLIFDIRWNNSPALNHWSWSMVFDPAATSNVYGAYGAGCVGQNTNPAGANYLAPGCIVAAKRGWESAGNRWSTDKEIGQMLRDGWMVNEASIFAFCPGNCSGGGPAVANKISLYNSTSVCPANSFSLTTCITFTVDGDPYDFFGGPGLRVLGTYAVGDTAILGIDDITYPGGPIQTSNTINLLQLVAINGTQLTFGCVYGPTHCAPADGNPQMLWMQNNWPGMNYPWSNGGVIDLIAWNYVNDPHGTNATGNTVVLDYSTYNAHFMDGNSLFSSGGTNSPRCIVGQGCYNNQNFQGTTDAQLAAKMLIQTRDNVTGLVAMSSSFAGLQGFNGACGNDNCQTHPDYSKLGSDPVSNYGIDIRPFVGIGGIPNTTDITCVAGGVAGAQCAAGSYLYKVANGSSTLHMRIFDVQVTSARRVLRNITGPGSVIASDSTGYYTWCFALKVNECRSGSAIGDFYVNIPYLDTFIPGSQAGSACYFPPGGFATNGSDNWSINDLCIYDAGMETQSATRYALNTFDMQGWSEQTFGHLFNNGRASIFSGIHAATNITANVNQWYYFPAQFWDGTFATMMMKAPPIALDSGTRTTFEPVTVNIKQISGGNGAGVEYGYAEYNNNCTPNRNEPCVAISATVNTTTPFFWENSETYTPLSCASTCSIQVPALPERVVYVRPVYYSGTTILSRGPWQVIPVP